MNNLMARVIPVSVLLLVGCKPVPTQDSATRDTSAPVAQTQVVGDTASDETDTPVQVEGAGSFVDYDTAQVASAAENGTALLFFHAKWCPTCRAAEKDINSRLGEIPEGLTIFKTDYDTQTELKKKYGVTYQHTFVQVDAEGNMIKSWNGGNLDEIIQQVES